MADPGFPVGGGMDLVGGDVTPEVVMFQKFCMSKRKNLDPLGGVRRARLLDPPMVRVPLSMSQIYRDMTFESCKSTLCFLPSSLSVR